MKLPEFYQTAYQKVVEWLFRPILIFRIIEPFGEVEDSFVISPAVLNRGHNFLDIINLRSFDVVCFSEYL